MLVNGKNGKWRSDITERLKLWVIGLTLGMMFHGQGMTGFFPDTGGLSWIKI